MITDPASAGQTPTEIDLFVCGLDADRRPGDRTDSASRLPGQCP